MTEETLKKNIAQNIAYCRKAAGMTQAELAELLAYSDKSVSKWERGDGLPDIVVLSGIAEILGVTVNDLIADTPPQKAPVKKRPARRVRVLVPVIAALLPWLIGTVLFTALDIFCPELQRLWLIYVYAAAISSVVLIVFGHIWWNKVLGGVFVSSLIWIAAVCFYLTFRNRSLWSVFIVSAVLQLLTVLWYLLIAGKKGRGKKQPHAEAPAQEKQNETDSTGGKQP